MYDQCLGKVSFLLKSVILIFHSPLWVQVHSKLWLFSKANIKMTLLKNKLLLFVLKPFLPVFITISDLVHMSTIVSLKKEKPKCSETQLRMKTFIPLASDLSTYFISFHSFFVFINLFLFNLSIICIFIVHNLFI